MKHFLISMIAAAALSASACSGNGAKHFPDLAPDPFDGATGFHDINGPTNDLAGADLTGAPDLTPVAVPDMVVVACSDNSQCDDGLYCNGAEQCTNDGVCVAGMPPQIDDGVACTDDSCDEVNDLIVNTPNNTLCTAANTQPYCANAGAYDGMLVANTGVCSQTDGCVGMQNVVDNCLDTDAHPPVDSCGDDGDTIVEQTYACDSSGGNPGCNLQSPTLVQTCVANPTTECTGDAPSNYQWHHYTSICTGDSDDVSCVPQEPGDPQTCADSIPMGAECDGNILNETGPACDDSTGCKSAPTGNQLDDCTPGQKYCVGLAQRQITGCDPSACTWIQLSGCASECGCT